MKNLFGEDVETPPRKTAHQITRKADPETSLAAAKKIIPKMNDLHREVMEKFSGAGDIGLTDYELEETLNNHGSTYRTRRAELVELRMIRDSGTKRKINGRDRIVWVLVK